VVNQAVYTIVLYIVVELHLKRPKDLNGLWPGWHREGQLCHALETNIGKFEWNFKTSLDFNGHGGKV